MQDVPSVRTMSAEERSKFLEENLSLFSDKMRKYHFIIKDLVEVNMMNLTDKALMAPVSHHGLLSSYYAEQLYLAKLRKFKKLKHEEFVKKYGQPNVPRYQTEEVVKNSDEMHEIEERIFEQEFLVQYLKDSLDSVLKSFHFDLKTAAECMKLEK